MVRLFKRFTRDRQKLPLQAADEERVSARELFAQQGWNDLWQEADMPSVVAYLLGNRFLALPPSWRELFPPSL